MVQYGRSTILATSFYITRYAHGVDTKCTWINTKVTYCGVSLGVAYWLEIVWPLIKCLQY